ncbi:MAG: hypoxanthine phosphoribosyltransferase, partial [Clostridiales bacterium]|nr:hypoxanthine phosphoribosyltransferase [Clostridiales bacterium]
MKIVELYSGETVRNRVKELAEAIKRDYPSDETLVCVCVLRGAVLFFSDLVKAMPDMDLRFDFVTLSSYENAVYSSGRVKLIADMRENVEGKNVIVVEDIVDSGHTVKYLRQYFESKKAKSCRIACLLDKPCNRQVDVTADYTAFVLDRDRYIVGYGLDAAQRYRNLDGVYEFIVEAT